MLDRALSVAAVVTLLAAVFVAGRLGGSEQLLGWWLVLLEALGFGVAALNIGDPWMTVLVAGMLGVVLEFLTPWTPLNRLLNISSIEFVVFATLAVAALAYVNAARYAARKVPH